MEFEKKLKSIEEIAKQLESVEIPLDQAIELYSQAIKDCNECLKLLKSAKGKIEVLNTQQQESETTD